MKIIKTYKLNKEQYDRLNYHPLNLNLKMCYYSDCATGILKATPLLKEIYNEVTGEQFKIGGGCADCLKRLMNTVAKWFFEYKEKIEIEQPIIIEGEKNESIEPIITIPPTEEPVKKERYKATVKTPKKATNNKKKTK